jgi:hypothetical protein
VTVNGQNIPLEEYFKREVQQEYTYMTRKYFINFTYGISQHLDVVKEMLSELNDLKTMQVRI